jgi:hypothetical protein
MQPPSNTRTGHDHDPAHGLRAGTGGPFILSQTTPEWRWSMKARSCKLGVEALDDCFVPSTVAYGDFNHDGLVDMAAITTPTTVTVSLANPDGSYAVAAALTGPRNQTLVDISVVDADGDGNLDISALSSTNNGTYISLWLGNGDGSFDAPTTDKWRPFGHTGHGGTW